MNEKEKLERKLKRAGREDLIRELETLRDKEAIDGRILRNAKQLQTIVDAQNDDQDLLATLERAKDLKAPYNEAQRANKDIARYLNLIAKERGYVD